MIAVGIAKIRKIDWNMKQVCVSGPGVSPSSMMNTSLGRFHLVLPQTVGGTQSVHLDATEAHL